MSTSTSGASPVRGPGLLSWILRTPLALLRVCLILPWIVAGLFAVGVIYPFASAEQRARMNRRWSRILLGMCGLRIAVQGDPILHDAVLYVANHVSWLDIFVMNAVRPTAFVAKSEIRSWPVVGWLVAGAGTVFIERGQRRAVQGVAEAMRVRFDRGEAVGLYPEGTTSDGSSLLPFHAGLFQPARMAGAPIQPVALRYRAEGERAAFPAFVGEETLVTNVLRLLLARHLNVAIQYLPALDNNDQDRILLARKAYDSILAAIQSSEDPAPPAH